MGVVYSPCEKTQALRARQSVAEARQLYLFRRIKISF